MMRRAWLMLVALACLSCGDDETSPNTAAFEPLCGEDGPVRILPLDPARLLYSGPWFSVQGEALGERYVFEVALAADPNELITQLWSVGRCGEDPLLLADDITTAEFIETYPQWPDLRFVCDAEAQVLMAVDPTGEREAHATFAAGDCRVLATEAGLLTVLGGQETGPLVLQPWPSDPLAQTAEQIVLHEAIRARPDPYPSLRRGDIRQVMSARGLEVLAVTGDDELVSIDLQDSTATVVQTGVSEFQQTSSGDWIIWQEVGPLDHPDVLPHGPIYFHHRASGESTYVADGSLANTSYYFTLPLEAVGLAYLNDGSAPLYVTLPDLQILDSIGGMPARVIDDHRALLQLPYAIYDADTRTATPLFNQPYAGSLATDQGLEILLGEGGELIEIDYDTGERRTLAEHASPYWRRTADDRVVTLAFSNPTTSSGPLTIIDSGTLSSDRIDTDVHDTSITTYEAPDALMLSYAVVDDDPARNGIWLARLAN